MSAALPIVGGEPDMTDARYPERWLNDRRVRRLSDRAHRVFITAMAWAASNKTGGRVEPEDIAELPVVPDRALRDELVKSGLWARDGQDFVITEFDGTQTSAAELEKLERTRLQARIRKARERDRSRDVTRDHTGEARQGKDRPGREVGKGSPSVPSPRVRDRTERGWDE